MNTLKKVLVINNHPDFTSKRTQMMIDSLKEAGYDVVSESAESISCKGIEFDFVVVDELSEER